MYAPGRRARDRFLGYVRRASARGQHNGELSGRQSRYKTLVFWWKLIAPESFLGFFLLICGIIYARMLSKDITTVFF